MSVLPTWQKVKCAEHHFCCAIDSLWNVMHAFSMGLRNFDFVLTQQSSTIISRLFYGERIRFGLNFIFRFIAVVAGEAPWSITTLRTLDSSGVPACLLLSESLLNFWSFLPHLRNNILHAVCSTAAEHTAIAESLQRLFIKYSKSRNYIINLILLPPAKLYFVPFLLSRTVQ